MPISIGDKLGPYEILEKIGAGGMGEVHRAHDTRLGRNVAVKFLPAQFAGDSDRLRRFELEARATGLLNHPNILAIYDIGTYEGSPYLVSELLEGETLRDRLNSGAIPSKRTTEYAAQIANGLAAAHLKGIVHRDLKPENLFITRDGRMKVLDFGLAKLAQTPEDNHSRLPTLASDPGTVLGTVGYMSPEQVRGEKVDHRSDIFALGAIIYEMLSGRRAFRSSSAAETMSAILREDPPDFDSNAETIAPGLERIVRRCLEKQPERRFQSVSDLGFALETLSDSSLGRLPASTEAKTFNKFRFISKTILVVAVLSIAFVIGSHWTPTQRSTGWEGRWLGGPTYAGGPRISPDGKSLAFQTVIDNRWEIGVTTPEAGTWSVQTRGRPGMTMELCWSNDGTRIYFDRFLEQPIGIFSVPARGNGDESVVLPDAMWPSVLSDGSLVVTKLNSGRYQLYRFRPETQQLDALPAFPATSINSNAGARPVPGGHEVVFFGKPKEENTALDHLYVLDLNTATTRRLAPDTILPQGNWNFPFVVTNDGEVFFDLPAGDLHQIVAAPIDGSTRLRPVLTLTEWPVEMDMAADGTLYLDQLDEVEEIFRFSPDVQHLERFPLPRGHPGGYRYLISLPDGRIVTSLIRSPGHDRLVVMEPGGDAKPFMQTEEETGGPVAMIGSNQLAFMQGTGSKRTVAIATLDGRPIRKMSNLPRDIQMLAGSTDGNTLFYVSAGNVWSVAATTSDALPKKMRPGVAIAIDPGGQYLLVESVDAGSNQLIRVPLSGGSEQPITISGETRPAVGNSISPQAIANDGRIAVRVVLKDSATWPVAIVDSRAGTTKALLGFNLDMITPGFDNNGRLIVGAFAMRSSLWRFRPVKR